MKNFEWLNGRPLFASISGGKDSTALGLWLLKNKIKFKPVFIDTGWEHKDTYNYIANELTELFGDFIILRNDKFFKSGSDFAGGMEQLIEKEKMFPNGKIKFCTRHLKVIPIQNFLSEIRASYKKKPVNIIGIRAEESFKRSKMEEIEEQDEATVWRPLINYTYEDIIDIHHEFNVSPNPLYLRGYSRVGCYPCIFSRKHEIRHMALSDPERIQHLKELENKITNLRTDGQTATFFKSRKKGIKKMSMDEIVGWAKSDNISDLEQLEEIEDSGCMRWGLCDTTALDRIEEKKETDLFNWQSRLTQK